MKIQEAKEAIAGIAGPVVERFNGFVVDVRIQPERHGAFVQVFADTDKGITIDQCAEITRELRPLLAQRQIVPSGDLRLEVSSPGMDRPLKLLRQYSKNVGRRFSVRFGKVEEPSMFKGVLTEVNGDTLTFQPDGGEPLSLAFHQIIESTEELPW
jgi:ribosome maturation factor RimP